jgi:YesN/AraC family two-component response regulator
MKSISHTIPSISILMVEDEVCFITLAKKYPGFKLYQALDGKTGLELFKAHTPDIVITDLSMPEISGVQIAVKIREIKPDTKFIVITGNMEKLSGEVSFDANHWIPRFVRCD